MYELLSNHEPHFIFLSNSGYIQFMSGVFFAFLILLMLSVKKKQFHFIWFFIGPLISGIIFNSLPNAVSAPLRLIIQFLDFPICVLEAVLYVQLVASVSRFLLQKFSPNPKKTIPERSLLFIIVNSIISVICLTAGIVFLLYGFDKRLIRKSHGAAFAGLIGSFILTITADNGIISDPCFIFLRVSLSLSPITSASAGFLTVILRLFLVISSFISIKFNYGEEKKLLKKSKNSIIETVYYITQSVTSKRSGTALVCLLVSFVFPFTRCFYTSHSTHL